MYTVDLAVSNQCIPWTLRSLIVVCLDLAVSIHCIRWILRSPITRGPLSLYSGQGGGGGSAFMVDTAFWMRVPLEPVVRSC
jgi:hypothetical protein